VFGSALSAHRDAVSVAVIGLNQTLPVWVMALVKSELQMLNTCPLRESIDNFFTEDRLGLVDIPSATSGTESSKWHVVPQIPCDAGSEVASLSMVLGLV